MNSLLIDTGLSLTLECHLVNKMEKVHSCQHAYGQETDRNHPVMSVKIKKEKVLLHNQNIKLFNDFRTNL